MEPCTTHTYALKSVRWHNYTDNTMLLQGNQPWISNPRVVILNDAYGEISPDAFAFIEDCYDRKITGTREQPAVFQKIRCFWDKMQFCIETELNLITYTLMTEDDDEVVFLPVAKRYGNGMQKQLIATDLFQSYEAAERCVDAFLGATQAMHLFHRVDILVKCNRWKKQKTR